MMEKIDKINVILRIVIVLVILAMFGYFGNRYFKDMYNKNLLQGIVYVMNKDDSKTKTEEIVKDTNKSIYPTQKQLRRYEQLPIEKKLAYSMCLNSYKVNDTCELTFYPEKPIEEEISLKGTYKGYFSKKHPEVEGEWEITPSEKEEAMIILTFGEEHTMYTLKFAKGECGLFLNKKSYIVQNH